MGAIRLRIVKVAVSLLLVGLCVVTLPRVGGHWLQAARRQWKNDAIPAIGNLADDKIRRAREIEALTKPTNDRRVIAQGWLTDKMILMQNGEWLVYESHCSKEKPRLVKDIFLAKGSDGNWYYSTFHFCVGMIGLLGEQETQPFNLAMFVHEYNLRQFDGRSVECLKVHKTWPASWDV